MAGAVDIFETLRHRLMTNVYDHGAKVRAEALKQEFGCSASTVREALFRLSTLGLVTFQEQRGFRVPRRSDALLRELTHLRVLLEAEGAALSIRHGGVAWEAQLSAAHHQLSHLETRMQGADDKSPFVDLWFAAEQHFHQTLIASCGSDVLKETHYRVYCRFRQQLMVEDLGFDFISMNIQHHQEILNAALSGNEALTRQKIHDHLARHLRHDAPEPVAG
ncbi:GntR family transcriptional regulator [Thalassococcus sp. CAU 1522]|uniref:GntR family transcriptional regulator n=1 Tax=Thalassococcus arenae TaxID=2851652 RepID=A0ABS6N6S6_9RHOB|nr:GntR family transcriptional regulator [Thalassococcus arenae]MBV2359488.1 GntR family transcriptional regulator [Thalassococcus arenae]